MRLGATGAFAVAADIATEGCAARWGAERVIEPLLTIDDAAWYFNVSRRWVKDAARAGRLRFTRVGKRRRRL